MTKIVQNRTQNNYVLCQIAGIKTEVLNLRGVDKYCF